ncbi:MAG: winged helix DNA-binding domain-containing protein [Proteobacteria bacterium]|nr:winged helix DNA-binding domain-containing protein [Pseudomonadota bacterium]
MRRLFLGRQGIAPVRPGFDKARLAELVERLGYVQVDSINVVERAHHLILFAREPRYRRELLAELLERDRRLFEHWTHDASILPVSYFPHWRHRFEDASAGLARRYLKKRLGRDPKKLLDAVRKRIRREGPLRSRDFESDGSVKRGPWWSWTQEKSALEYLWHSGELGISHRDDFQKVYDRIENVVPARERRRRIGREASIAWKCREAVTRLGAATPAEIAAFWGSFSLTDARAWVEVEEKAGRLIPVAIETADGSKPRTRMARPDFLESLEAAPRAPRGMRLLSPFDPVIRDRKRTAWLFGFHYRIEVFVPAAQREYGYYVMPILEGDRLTGRIDLKTHRETSHLEVKGLWWEPGVAVTAARKEALRRCLDRLARFVGVREVRSLGAAWRKAGTRKRPK